MKLKRMNTGFFVECKKYMLCGGCALIQHEMRLKKKLKCINNSDNDRNKNKNKNKNIEKSKRKRKYHEMEGNDEDTLDGLKKELKGKKKEQEDEEI